jgi:hypothetical protein
MECGSYSDSPFLEMNFLQPHSRKKHRRVKPGSSVALESLMTESQLQALAIKYYTPAMEQMKREVEQCLEERKRKKRIYYGA